MPRFDEIELQKGVAPALPPSEPDAGSRVPSAPLWRRAVAFLIDLSLFGALAMAMWPLVSTDGSNGLTPGPDAGAMIGLGGFLLLLSYYYFVLSWLIWGRTIGSAILELRIVEEGRRPIHFARASRRWLATVASVLLAGFGFLPALFPGHRSLPDRFSGTVPVLAR
ncbi:MAG TPA: RDD family protein [Thermoanaerobaculia bacterium]|nr:RDD family protein [Thermoanaerobaculia bacterium]